MNTEMTLKQWEKQKKTQSLLFSRGELKGVEKQGA